jgi:outer membrane cobalamin receptor
MYRSLGFSKTSVALSAFRYLILSTDFAYQSMKSLAVYQNGVRVNEVFGDVVNWDFIPETAINRMTLMPSNPLYGLNALGGALSIDMKNGFTYQGTETELRGGSFGRRSASVQTGGQATGSPMEAGSSANT